MIFCMILSSYFCYYYFWMLLLLATSIKIYLYKYVNVLCISDSELNRDCVDLISTSNVDFEL